MATMPTFSHLPYARLEAQQKAAKKEQVLGAVGRIGKRVGSIVEDVGDRKEQAIRYSQAQQSRAVLVKAFAMLKKKDPEKYYQMGGTDPARAIPPPPKRASEQKMQDYLNTVTGAVGALLSTGVSQGLITMEDASTITGIAPNSPELMKLLQPTMQKASAAGIERAKLRGVGEQSREAMAGRPPGQIFGPISGQDPPPDQPQPMETVVPGREELTPQTPGGRQEWARRLSKAGVTDITQHKKGPEWESLQDRSKGITEYQERSLDIAKMKFGEATTKADIDRTVRDIKAFELSSKGFSSALDSKGKTLVSNQEKLTEIPKEVAGAGKQIAEIKEEMSLLGPYDTDQKTSLGKQLMKLENQIKELEKLKKTITTENERINLEMPGIQENILINAEAIAIYQTPGVSFGEARRRATEIITGRGKSADKDAPPVRPAERDPRPAPVAAPAAAPAAGGAISAEDQGALKFVRDNPSDPRTPAVIAALKKKGLL